jgi:hypothetical protein
MNFIIFFIICSIAGAAEVKRSVTSESQSALDIVVIDRSHLVPKIGPDWSDKTKKELYGGDPSASPSVDKFASTALYQTPLSAFTVAKESRSSNFSEKSGTIAHQCKQLNPDLVWAQITCAAKSVKASLKKFKWPNSSTACRAHAEAFREVFLELNIPRSDVGFYDANSTAGPHVVNRITVTDKNGRPFSYVFDIGWDPDRIFPLGELAKEFHQNNKTLPDIKSTAPKYDFQGSDQKE